MTPPFGQLGNSIYQAIRQQHPSGNRALASTRQSNSSICEATWHQLLGTGQQRLPGIGAVESIRQQGYGRIKQTNKQQHHLSGNIQKHLSDNWAAIFTWQQSSSIHCSIHLATELENYAGKYSIYQAIVQQYPSLRWAPACITEHPEPSTRQPVNRFHGTTG